MRYGFVIDQRRCIGCHACTVACKEENQVPLGVNRTWVKYIEKGTFPDTRRYFSVMRCNHCDNPPCVTICPTVALYRRSDGIVDFDGARCIGCKSCMQACPYDALYIDPETQTAAKCHYCAHRVEVGLEPACVIVCPVQAIVPGDLDDPGSTIARLVASQQTQVRKPEQGTQPKLFYLGAEEAALTPDMQAQPASYVFSQRGAIPVPGQPGMPYPAAAAGGGESVDLLHMARTVYDVAHPERPWGWKVSTYLWTKSIAAGSLLVTALLGTSAWGGLADLVAPVIALVFLTLTTALLVLDLKRPERFLYILFKPNPRSWLVWGGFILIAYGGAATLWLFGGLTGRPGLVDVAVVPTVVLALAAAGYSAFLFGQAEGRDFWQSPLLLPHLLVAAVVAGSAALLIARPDWSWLHQSRIIGSVAHRFVAPPPAASLGPLLFAALLAHAFLLFAELASRHASHEATRAARSLTNGPARRWLWAGVIAGGHVVPMLLVMGAAATESALLSVAAAVLALAGLWLWEDLWVRAGQSVPLS